MKKIYLLVLLVGLFTCAVQAQVWKKSICPKVEGKVAFDTERGEIVVLSENEEMFGIAETGWYLLSKRDKEFSKSHYGYGELVYNENRDVFVFFSGYKVWEWNRTHWKVIGEDPKHIYSVTFHPGRNSFLFFDKKKKETWEWKAKSWKKLEITNPSGKLSTAKMVYDFSREKMLLLTSRSKKSVIGVFELNDDGWILETEIKEEKFEAKHFKVVYNPVSNNIWILNTNGTKVCAWDGKNGETHDLKEKIEGKLISDRNKKRLLSYVQSYDKCTINSVAINGIKLISELPISLTDRVSKYAYDTENGRFFALEQFFGKLYTWNGLSWEVTEQKHLGPWYGGGLIFDPWRKRLVYFGGGESSAFPNEDGHYYPVFKHTFIWKGGKFKRIAVDAPQARATFAMANNFEKSTIWLFGGNNFEIDEYRPNGDWETGGLFGDTWELKGNQWRKYSASGPPARAGASMTFDRYRGKMILFGGYREFYDSGEAELLGDTWEWDSNAWKLVSNSGPRPQYGAAMYFDENIKQIVMFAGSRNSLNKDDQFVWRWDGKKWLQGRKVTELPQKIYGKSVFYDHYTGQAIGHQSWWNFDLLYNFGPYRPTISASADYDGDGKADPVTFGPRSGQWLQETGETTHLGKFHDVPAPGDYNGDGRAEKLVFRPDTGEWLSEKGLVLKDFGKVGDVPVPGDYDGDGKDDIAYFRPSEGIWQVNNVFQRRLGEGHDVPVPGDYNGDGKIEIAVYRAKSGNWIFADGSKIKFGGYQDIPVPADYDGDGKTDLAIYRQKTGQWLFKGRKTIKFGYPEDRPIPADYDGDGKADLAVYRPNTGQWVFADGRSIALGKPHSIPVH